MRRAMTRGEFTRAMHSDPRDAIARELARERDHALATEANAYPCDRMISDQELDASEFDAAYPLSFFDYLWAVVFVVSCAACVVYVARQLPAFVRWVTSIGGLW